MLNNELTVNLKKKNYTFFKLLIDKGTSPALTPLLFWNLTTAPHPKQKSLPGIRK